MVLHITSLQNPKVKFASKLMERRDREKSGYFLIEGYREVLRALENGQEITTLFFCPPFFLGTNENALLEKVRGELIETSVNVFKSLSYRDRPDGLLAIASKRTLTLSDLKRSQNPFYVVAEAIEKPGNLGTILRTGDGVGVDGVIVADRCTDIFNPNVVRASVGTLFTLPVVEATTEETLIWLKQQGIKIVAATPEATLDYTDANFKQPLAIVVGTEQYGLSSRWKEASDIQVSIPMKGDADSLNVSIATALLMYEVHRQRKT